ncbi:MAG TPA: hypothetical protein PLQ88_12715 [Blastocatellia bacterium]|nr:hypothetical protein [Blastocatellia bacterium]HMY72675.1 hypothetical protein [Blastocatellia bacterium]
MSQQQAMISDGLLNRLQSRAQLHGVSLEQLLDEWERKDAEIEQRQEAGRRIDEIFARMSAKYGVMPDSAELIREDRDSR